MTDLKKNDLITILDFYLHVYRNIASNKPANKPMWMFAEQYGDDDLDLARAITDKCWTSTTTEYPSFKVVATTVKMSKVSIVPDNIEFTIYNEGENK